MSGSVSAKWATIGGGVGHRISRATGVCWLVLERRLFELLDLRESRANDPLGIPQRPAVFVRVRPICVSRFARMRCVGRFSVSRSSRSVRKDSTILSIRWRKSGVERKG
jgi:hypothetical protein